MDAKTLITQINEKMNDANIDLDLVDPRLRVGADGRKRSAVSEVERLKKQYKDTITENVVIIAVKGKYAKKFAELAAKYKATSVDFLSTDDLISQNVARRSGRDTYDTQEHWMVLDELNAFKLKYNIASLSAFQCDFADLGFNRPLKEMIHNMLVKHYNGTIYSIATKAEIGEKALDIQFQGKWFPVILYNYDVELDTKVLPSPTVILTVDEEIDEKFVKQQLNDVRNAVTSQNQSSNKGE